MQVNIKVSSLKQNNFTCKANSATHRELNGLKPVDTFAGLLL